MRRSVVSRLYKQSAVAHDLWAYFDRLLVITVGVPLWNSGDYAACAAVYKSVVIRFMHADDSLAKAVADCEGKSTGPAKDGQGWLLRNAVDACLVRINAVSSQAIICL